MLLGSLRLEIITIDASQTWKGNRKQENRLILALVWLKTPFNLHGFGTYFTDINGCACAPLCLERGRLGLISDTGAWQILCIPSNLKDLQTPPPRPVDQTQPCTSVLKVHLLPAHPSSRLGWAPECSQELLNFGLGKYILPVLFSGKCVF